MTYLKINGVKIKPYSVEEPMNDDDVNPLDELPVVDVPDQQD